MVAATLTSAMVSSSLGRSTEGCTSDEVGFCGRGGVTFLTTTLLGAQMATWGTGMGIGSVMGLGTSGWRSVCGPGGAGATSRKAGTLSDGLLAEAGARAPGLDAGFG